MHGQQSMKFLNGNAVAQAIMAERKVGQEDVKLTAIFKEYMAEKAKAAQSK